jgi:hypothetical protein
MRLRFVFILLAAVWFAETARAEAFAPAPADSACLSASVQAESTGDGELAYRIAFRNLCGAPRSFSWCAENAHARVPAEIGCAGGGGLFGEQRYLVVHRKEFLWRLPRGTHIRFQDCPEQEIPTSLGCAPPATAAPRR